MDAFKNGHFSPYKDLASCSYEELASYAVLFLHQLDLSAEADNLAWYRASKPFLKRRGFARYRSALPNLSPLALAVSELFLLSRVRSQMLAYLSVQESGDFESAESNHGQLPTFLTLVLGALGKTLRARFAVRILGRRVVVEVDPFVHLRAIYFDCLRSVRSGNRSFRVNIIRALRVRTHRMMFHLKMCVCWRIGRMYGRRLSGLFLHRRESWFSEQNIEYYLLLAIYQAFPITSHLSQADWKTISADCTRFLAERVQRLVDIIPSASINDDGFAKLLKVAVGVIAGRASRMKSSRPNPAYITDTVKLAYCWGVTYPLVDNILDSASIPRREKEVLYEVIRLSFESDGVDLTAARAVATDASKIAEELVNCFETVFSISGSGNWGTTRHVLLLLLESHRKDSVRSLRECDGSMTQWEEIWADTVLKAALVRWATMCICGMNITPTDVCEGIETAPFNQLGDDLWDVTEDEQEDRATPVTLHRHFSSLPDPAILYFATARHICATRSDNQRQSVSLGVCEVVSDCFRAGTLSGQTTSLLRANDPDFPATLESACRVDPDAILFAFGRAANSIFE